MENKKMSRTKKKEELGPGVVEQIEAGHDLIQGSPVSTGQLGPGAIEQIEADYGLLTPVDTDELKPSIKDVYLNELISERDAVERSVAGLTLFLQDPGVLAPIYELISRDLFKQNLKVMTDLLHILNQMIVKLTNQDN